MESPLLLPALAVVDHPIQRLEHLHDASLHPRLLAVLLARLECLQRVGHLFSFRLLVSFYTV